MKRKGPRAAVIASCLGLVWVGAVHGAERIPVFVSILPQKYFVQKIGGDLVDVSVMVEPGASPATYEPKPRQMVAVSKAKAYFSIGVPFEKAWLKKIASSNPTMMVVHTDCGIRKLPMKAHPHHGEAEQPETVTHHEKAEDPRKSTHGQDEDPPKPGSLDPHIWLSPPLVMMQARTILIGLQQVDPARRSVYEAHHKAFVSEIAELDAELRNTFFCKGGLQFMVFHPAWGYFAHAYGLRQIPIEIEGKDAKPAQLRELIEHAKENHIKVIFVQPQFSSSSARLVAREIGARVAFVDPLAADWAKNLREVASRFKAALR
jgi:zinc transport system substrate-binding protein